MANLWDFSGVRVRRMRQCGDLEMSIPGDRWMANDGAGMDCVPRPILRKE